LTVVTTAVPPPKAARSPLGAAQPASGPESHGSPERPAAAPPGVFSTPSSPDPTAPVHAPGVPTARERRVLDLASHGLTTEQIGCDLGISVNTVRTHLKKAFTALRVHERGAAVAEGFRLGLLRLDPLPASATARPLEDRLAAVLPLLAAGLPESEIGARLGLTADGVGHRLTALYRLLGVSSRPHAVRVAAESGYLVLTGGAP
jgi:DNA-binding NarL/FixJ family response regulator